MENTISQNYQSLSDAMMTFVFGSNHTKDSDCTVDPKDDTCSVCGVYHGDACPQCGRRGFHKANCSTINEQIPEPEDFRHEILEDMAAAREENERQGDWDREAREEFGR